MSEVSRFQAPRPKFQASTNPHALEATTPRSKDTTPAPSVTERLSAEGNDTLAALLADAQKAARNSAQVIESVRKPRMSRSVVTDTTTTPKVVVHKFTADDVVDDRTFIRRTRDNIHSPEVQALFWANGGERHLVSGVSYAQALDNLRREKMLLLRRAELPTQTYVSVPKPTLGVSVTPGMPTQEDRIRREYATERVKRTMANERWAGIVRK